MMVKRDRPLPDRPLYYIISGHNKSTLLTKGREGSIPLFNPHSADVGGIFLSVVKSWSQKVFPFNLCGFNVTGACQISREQIN
jgi:hypothetical protein